jgi:hypothetical protein
MLVKAKQIASSILNYFRPEPSFQDLVKRYDVIIMKHCSPASDILEDEGIVDLSSDRQSLENFKAIYQFLGKLFSNNSNTLFLLWTLPPRHRLFQPLLGNREENAVRATAFSNWLKYDFSNKWNDNSNIYIWDYRSITMNPASNFLKHEYELDHQAPNSHPNRIANNIAGAQFAEFITKSIGDFFDSDKSFKKIRIIFLHHSIGLNVYQYPHLGLPDWFRQYNVRYGTDYLITNKWYPKSRNMPIDYYRYWFS